MQVHLVLREKILEQEIEEAFFKDARGEGSGAKQIKLDLI